MHEKEVCNTVCPTLLESHLVTHTLPIVSKNILTQQDLLSEPCESHQDPCCDEYSNKTKCENNGKTTKNQEENPDPSVVQQMQEWLGRNLDLKNLQLSKVETNGERSQPK